MPDPTTPVAGGAPVADTPEPSFDEAVAAIEQTLGASLPEDRRQPVDIAIAFHGRVKEMLKRRGLWNAETQALLGQARNNLNDAIYRRQTGKAINAGVTADVDDDSALTYLYKNAGIGLGKMYAGVGKLVGSEAAKQMSHELDVGEALGDQGIGAGGKLLGGAAKMGGRTLGAAPAVAGALLTAPASVPTGTALATAGMLGLGTATGASTAGDVYQEERDRGTAPGASALRAGAVGVTEALVTRFLPGAPGALGKRLAGDVATRGVGREVLDVSIQGAGAMGAMTAVSDLTRKALHNDDLTIGDVALNTLKASGQGALLNGVLHVGMLPAVPALRGAQRLGTGAIDALGRPVAEATRSLIPEAAPLAPSPRAAAIAAEQAAIRQAADLSPAVISIDEALARAEGRPISGDLTAQLAPTVERAVGDVRAAAAEPLVTHLPPGPGTPNRLVEAQRLLPGYSTADTIQLANILATGVSPADALARLREIKLGQWSRMESENADAVYRQKQIEASAGTTPPTPESVQRRAIAEVELAVQGRESQLQRDMNERVGGSRNVEPLRPQPQPLGEGWRVKPGQAAEAPVAAPKPEPKPVEAPVAERAPEAPEAAPPKPPEAPEAPAMDLGEHLPEEAINILTDANDPRTLTVITRDRKAHDVVDLGEGGGYRTAAGLEILPDEIGAVVARGEGGNKVLYAHPDLAATPKPAAEAPAPKPAAEAPAPKPVAEAPAPVPKPVAPPKPAEPAPAASISPPQMAHYPVGKAEPGATTVVRAVEPGGKRAQVRPGLKVVERVGGDRAVVSDGKGAFFVATGDRELIRKAAAKGEPQPWHVADLTKRFDTLEAAQAEAKRTASAVDVTTPRPPGESRGPQAKPVDKGSIRKWLDSEDAPADLRERWADTKNIRDQVDREIAQDRIIDEGMEAFTAQAREIGTAGAKTEKVVDVNAEQRLSEEIDATVQQVAHNDLNSRIDTAIKAVEDLSPAGAKAHLERLVAEAEKSPEVSAQVFVKAMKNKKLVEAMNQPWTADFQRRFIDYMRNIREQYAKMRLLVPDAEGRPAIVDDGMAPAERGALVDELAKSLGLKIERHEKLTHEGKDVLGFSDGDTIHLSAKAGGNLVDAVRAVGHEKMHSVITGLDAPARTKLAARVADILDQPGGGALVEHIAERWGISKSDAWHEAVADAGARAILRDRGNLLSLLPDAVSKPLRDNLRRLGLAIKGLLRRMVGLKGATPALREQLEDLAAELLTASRAKVPKDFVGPDVPFRDGLRTIGLDAEATKINDLARGALGAGVYKVGSIFGKRVGEGFRQFYLRAIAEAQSVAERFPAFGRVWDHHHAARQYGAHLNRMFAERLEWVANLSKDESLRLGKFGTDLRVEQIARRDAGLKPLTTAEARAWLKSRGASDADAAKLHRLHSTMDALWDTRLSALYEFAGMKRMPLERLAAMVQETKDFLGSMSKGEAKTKLEQRLRTMEALHEVASAMEGSRAASYIPLIRQDKGYVIEAFAKNADGTKGEKLGRTAASCWGRAAAEAKLREQFPDAHFEINTDGIAAEQAFGKDMAEKVRALAADAGVSAEHLNSFLADVQEALVRGKFDAHLLKAKGLAGYELDLRATIPQYVSTVNNGLRKMKFQALAKDDLSAIAGSTDEGLKHFTRAWTGDVYNGQHGVMRQISDAVRLGSSAMMISSVRSGLTNLASAIAFNPWMLGIHTGRKASVARAAWNHMATSALTVPSVARDVANAVAHFTRYRDAVAHITGRSSGRFQVETVAKLLDASGDKSAAEALRYVGTHTDVLIDPYVGEFLNGQQSPTGKLARKVATGALIFQTVTDRANRIGTFTSTFQTARSFTAKEWNRAKVDGYHGRQNPRDYATWMTGKLNGHYGPAARPELFRGPVGSAAFQFSQYPMTVTKNLASGWKAVAKSEGLDAGVRAGMYLGMIGTFTAMGGMLALPFANGISTGITELSHLLPWEADPTKRKSADQWVDDLLGQVIKDDGALKFMRYGVGGVVEDKGLGSVLTGFGRTSVPTTIVDRLFSGMEMPSLSAAKNVVESGFGAAKEATAGNTEAAIRNASHLAGPWAARLNELRNVETTGIRDRSGDTLVPGSEVSDWEKRYMAAGGVPYKATQAREMLQLDRTLKQINRPATEPIINDLVDAMLRGEAGRADYVKHLNRLREHLKGRVEAYRNAKTPEDKAVAAAALQGLSGNGLRAAIKFTLLNRRYGGALPGGRANKFTFGMEQGVLGDTFLGTRADVEEGRADGEDGED